MPSKPLRHERVLHVVVHVQNERARQEVRQLDPVARRRVEGEPVQVQAQHFRQLQELRSFLRVNFLFARLAVVLVVRLEHLGPHVGLQRLLDAVIGDLRLRSGVYVVELVLDDELQVEPALEVGRLAAFFPALDVVERLALEELVDRVVGVRRREADLEGLEEHFGELLHVVLHERVFFLPLEALRQRLRLDEVGFSQLHLSEQLLQLQRDELLGRTVQLGVEPASRNLLPLQHFVAELGDHEQHLQKAVHVASRAWLRHRIPWFPSPT